MIQCIEIQVGGADELRARTALLLGQHLVPQRRGRGAVEIAETGAFANHDGLEFGDFLPGNLEPPREPDRVAVLLDQHIEARLTEGGIGDDEFVALGRIAGRLPQRLAELQGLCVLGEARVGGEQVG